jgi:DNA-binding transcriptional regulator YdaS (Cro superfamily)
MNRIEALRKAIDNAGGQTALARALGLKSQGSISNWLLRDKRVPAERVLEVERATGVSRHDLRPDLYPREPPVVQQFAASA